MTVTIHTRYVTSDFDEGEGPGQLFDEDARVGMVRAYRQALRYVRALPKTRQMPNWKDVRSTLRPALARIARDYWRDFDYDNRKNSAKVKVEAQKLISALKTTIAALEERPTFVRRALNSEATRSVAEQTSDYQNLYATALATNRALLQACQLFDNRDHRKRGVAIRFPNACRELAALWEDIFNRKFARNYKTGKATDSEAARGVERVFESPGAAFVYLILHEIGNRWVTVSQVQEALRALREGK